MIAWLLVAVWLVPWYFLIRIAPRKPALKEFPPRTGRPLSVIIPARNEAGMIERCVHSILRSTYTPLEVIVVDDRSTDDTAAIVERMIGSDPSLSTGTGPRLRLVHGADLPAGWYGKPWACVQGLRASTGEILCFTDADTVHEPELLARSVSGMEAMGASLFTVMPFQECLTWSERLILPQFFYLRAARFHPSVVNRARRAKDAIANGQFILMTRAEYERIGTHEKVKHEVAEDLALGQEVMLAGGKVRMVYALEYMRTRMYTHWAHLREGFSKNLFLGSRRSLKEHPIFARFVSYLVGATFLIWLLPPAALLLRALGVDVWAQGPALWATGSSVAFWVTFSMAIGVPFWWGLLYPIGALGAFDIALLSAIRGKRRVEWKGRVYGTGQRV
ncbi:MAG TPA: glycosyltransferase family 2 protein [Gemmatimonadales bacterium]|nr:glycosyltransferase family 2 protein [Gemmatimonadales bacterium]